MLTVATNILFWIGNCKKRFTKSLIARHFVIISLSKNCAWLQQFYKSIKRLMKRLWAASETCPIKNILKKIFWKKTKCKCTFIINFKQRQQSQTVSHSLKYRYVSLERSYKAPVEKDLMRTISLYVANPRLNLSIILCILHVLIILINNLPHSFPKNDPPNFAICNDLFSLF